MKRLIKVLSLAASVPVMAAGPDVAGVSGMVSSLLLILGLFVLAAWLVRRYLPQTGKASPVKVIGATALGPRERIIVVEVDDTWLVLGAGGGQLRTLHTLPKPKTAEGKI
jgi:flagellar protein FliO/FliZ